MKKTIFLIALYSAFFVGICAYSEEKATVIRVVDGDTITILYHSVTENIRLIGIDTPESKKNKKARKDAQRTHSDVREIVAMGKEAAGFTRQLLKKGTPVTIEFDVRPRDKYGRLLGYIYLPDKKMVNEEIIKAGYAYPMTIPPNVKYSERFRRAFEEARKKKAGLWK